MMRGFLYKLCQDHLGSDAPTCELRKLDLCKKGGSFGKANSRVGNADVANVVPTVKDRFVYEEREE